MERVFDTFEKRTSSFYISAMKDHINIDIFGESVTTKVAIIGEADIFGGLEILGEEHEWIDMGGWYISYIHGVLEFVCGDVVIKLNLLEKEVRKIFNIILSDRSL